MAHRSSAGLVIAAVFCIAAAACAGSTDGPTTESCSELADQYVAAHHQAVDAVDTAQPDIPDSLGSGEDGERLDRILHVIGGLDWIERTSDIAVQWEALGCEPQDLTEVLRDRAAELSYDTLQGRWLVETYFGL
jgi:hypothetical protein